MVDTPRLRAGANVALLPKYIVRIFGYSSHVCLDGSLNLDTSTVKQDRRNSFKMYLHSSYTSLFSSV